MDPTTAHLAQPFGRPGRPGAAAELEARLRLVLETRPGRLPWRKDFGCDLAALVGEPSTPQNLGRASYHVEQAVRRWIPDVRVERCVVETRPVPGFDPRDGRLPPGEGALLSLGTQAVLLVRLELVTEHGPVHVSAAVQP